MGAENLGPLLYAWVRFAKPANVLEIGAGYTSMFLLRALEDNAAEIEARSVITSVPIRTRPSLSTLDRDAFRLRF